MIRTVARTKRNKLAVGRYWGSMALWYITFPAWWISRGMSAAAGWVAGLHIAPLGWAISAKSKFYWKALP